MYIYVNKSVKKRMIKMTYYYVQVNPLADRPQPSALLEEYQALLLTEKDCQQGGEAGLGGGGRGVRTTCLQVACRRVSVSVCGACMHAYVFSIAPARVVCECVWCMHACVCSSIAPAQVVCECVWCMHAGVCVVQ